MSFLLWCYAFELERSGVVWLCFLGASGQVKHLVPVRELHDGGGGGAVLDGLRVVGARAWEGLHSGGVQARAKGASAISSCFTAAVEASAGLTKLPSFCRRGGYEGAWSSWQYVLMLG